MYLSQLSEPMRQRCCATGDVRQSLDHSVEFESSIEPIGELGQGAFQMLAVDGVIGTENRIVVDVPEHGIDPGELPGLHTIRAAGDNAPVGTSFHDR